MTRSLVWLIMAALFVLGGNLAPVGAAGLVSEHHRYDLDFLFFKNLAEGELRIAPTDEADVYAIELTGRTLGVAAWLTGDRTQIYRSQVRETDNGTFISLSYESRIRKRKGERWSDRTKRYRFDYERREILFEKARDDGAFDQKEIIPMPAGEVPVDMLAAFYNVRRGVYGPLTPGRTLVIPTFGSKGLTEIRVIVVADDDPSRPGYFEPDGLLLRVEVDPEVFETGYGDTYVWFDADGRPARGIVEDIIGLGDVRGRLRPQTQEELP